jgi:hypothetical protein
VEEYIFFDHPSGYNRIHDAMTWKKENLQLFAPGAGEQAGSSGGTAP